jgi:hypothetical protein
MHAHPQSFQHVPSHAPALALKPCGNAGAGVRTVPVQLRGGEEVDDWATRATVVANYAASPPCGALLGAVARPRGCLGPRGGVGRRGHDGRLLGRSAAPLGSAPGFSGQPISHRCVTSRHLTSRRATQRHVASPNVTSHHPTSRRITQHHVASPNVTSHHPSACCC